MKIIITEDKLYNTFSKFMDSEYNLAYNIRSREFIDKNNRPLGWLRGSIFFYGELSDEEFLEGYFGSKTNKLLLRYLRDNFPNLSIHTIS